MNEEEPRKEKICPLCQRLMPTGSYNEHHLIPATFKGRETIQLHKICHNAIHMNISNHDLKNYYNTIDELLNHPEIQKFVKWIMKKPPEFYKGHKRSKSISQ